MNGAGGSARATGTPHRATLPPWWRSLSSWGRTSFVGLGAAALLAIGLGLYIPMQVERHMLQAQADSNEQVLQALLGSRTLPVDDPESGFDELDRFVSSAILRGDFVRVKLWNPGGTILYSDDRRLVGRTFPPSPEILGALDGKPQEELSDLSAEENRLERGLARRLLEFYLPVEHEGRIVGVWEVYQSLDRFEERLSRVRVAVWTSVGAGLAVLLLFLVSSFGGLVSTIQRRRAEAEARSKDLAALLAISRSATSTLDPLTLSQAAVRTIRDEGGYAAVGLVVEPGDGPAHPMASVADDRCPPDWIDRALQDGETDRDGWPSLSVRLAGERGRSLWIVACGSAADGRFTDEDRVFLETAGEQIRMALDNARLYDSLRAAESERRRLTHRLVTAHEDEARRIVGEIHDGLGQDLHRILYGLRGFRAGPPEESGPELERLETVAAGSVHRLRRLLRDLLPSSIEDVGVGAALRGLVDGLQRNDGMQVALRVDDLALEELPVPVRVALFRIAQEGLLNVLRHAEPKRAVVEIGAANGSVRLRISDQGPGLPETWREGLGMWLMRERAESTGGRLSVESAASGTVVTALIPHSGAP